MGPERNSIRDLAGCKISTFEQRLYDQLLPYDWDDIYLSFKEEMVQNIARTLDIPEDSVNIKATTTEGMGPEGREECISSHAVATIRG